MEEKYISNIIFCFFYSADLKMTEQFPSSRLMASLSWCRIVWTLT